MKIIKTLLLYANELAYSTTNTDTHLISDISESPVQKPKIVVQAKK